MKEIIYASAQPTEMVRVNSMALIENSLNIMVNATELIMLAIGSLIILTVIYKKNQIKTIAQNFKLTYNPARLNIKDKIAIFCGSCLIVPEFLSHMLPPLDVSWITPYL